MLYIISIKSVFNKDMAIKTLQKNYRDNLI